MFLGRSYILKKKLQSLNLDNVGVKEAYWVNDDSFICYSNILICLGVQELPIIEW